MRRSLGGVLLMAFYLCTHLSCTHDDFPSLNAKTFVLVHGAWQAPYVWQQVKQGLESAGNKVLLVELPAHGKDTTGPQNVSIDVYREKVIAAINSVPEKVVLVGHSMGGMVVTSVAEKIPDRIEKLIYVGAFVPANGQALLELAAQDHQSLLGVSIVPSSDQLTLNIKQDAIVPVFCQDAPPEVQQQVVNNFRVEPAIPFTNKVAITDKNFGEVNKYYVHTLQDQAIGIDLQRAMVSAAKITKTYSINSGHCPFLSKPGELLDILKQIVR